MDVGERAHQNLCDFTRFQARLDSGSEVLDESTTAHLYTASYASRPVEAGSDVAVCFGGAIAVGKMTI